MSTIFVVAGFTQSSGQPATGLTLSDIELYLTSYNRSTGATAVVWDGTQSPTKEIDNAGQYLRAYTTADMDTYVYHARASYTGATDLDSDHVMGVLSGIDAGSILAEAGNKIADHTIRRSFASAAASANGDTKSFRSLLGAIAKQVNKISALSSTLTVYEADDITALATQTISTDADGDPIIGLDTN